MDLRIASMPSQGLGSIAQTKRPAAGSTAVAGAGFADNFKSALKSVSAAQNEATRLQTEVQRSVHHAEPAFAHRGLDAVLAVERSANPSKGILLGDPHDRAG